ncbi:hypothetical protein NDU88_003918 [Pleurodeles waltl]|uniref:Uncharacterized protein n=1 Tax=Pleurodeles waltl TaxID=8319 RepID=A0AAV7QBF5_PLEWA|nr:hypothetical protein NDU88_003918 [Pleurodeles waltl]
MWASLGGTTVEQTVGAPGEELSELLLGVNPFSLQGVEGVERGCYSMGCLSVLLDIWATECREIKALSSHFDVTQFRSGLPWYHVYALLVMRIVAAFPDWESLEGSLAFFDLLRFFRAHCLPLFPCAALISVVMALEYVAGY